MTRFHLPIVALLAIAGVLLPISKTFAASRSEIARDSRAALSRLYRHNESARKLGETAKAVLVFPKIIKAGFIIGGQGGEGALIENGSIVGYYNIGSASFGLQAGAQRYGYALFFMTDEALRYLRNTDGWEIGTGPSVVLVNEGVARDISTTTERKNIYAFSFSQNGLMAGLGIQGSKITRIHPY